VVGQSEIGRRTDGAMISTCQEARQAPPRPDRVSETSLGYCDRYYASAPLKRQEPRSGLSGRLGGLKGGQARRDALTPARRTAIAQKAATTRWKKRTP